MQVMTAFFHCSLVCNNSRHLAYHDVVPVHIHHYHVVLCLSYKLFFKV